MTISPLTSPRARTVSSNAGACPRKTSSCSLVSSRQTALTLGKHLRHRLERRDCDGETRKKSTRRAPREPLQTTHTVAVFSRQEALEEKMLAGNTGRNQGRHASRGPGNNLAPRRPLTRRVDQHLARIGHARHAGIRGKRESLARQQTIDQFGGAAGDNILVATNKWLGNTQMHQQL